MQILLNLGRIGFAVLWTCLVGIPVVAVNQLTYVFGKLCALVGREDVLTRIVERNATAMGSVAKYWWAPVLLKSCGVTGWHRETQPIDWARPYVVCCNHASIFDILILVTKLPLPFRFVAKRELLKWPVIGWSLRPSGQIIVDRQRRDDAIQSIAEATRRRIGGQVVFFVEGTRTPDGSLLPFKRGAFHFALANQMPVLPTAIVGSFAALARQPWWQLHPGRHVGVVFGAPIDTPCLAATDKATDKVDEISAATRAQIEELLQQTEAVAT